MDTMSGRFSFGDLVTNTVAGVRNPHKHSIFVRYVCRTGKMNPGEWAQCTDGKGEFWESNPQSLEMTTGPRPPSDYDYWPDELKRRVDNLIGPV